VDRKSTRPSETWIENLYMQRFKRVNKNNNDDDDNHHEFNTWFDVLYYKSFVDSCDWYRVLKSIEFGNVEGYSK